MSGIGKMMLVEETEVPQAALPVAEFRAHLRMATGFAEVTETEAFLGGLLRAALAAIEARTGKALMARVFVLTLPGWRWPDAQTLPLAPVTEVLSVMVAAPEGLGEPVDPARWWLEADLQRPRLRARGTVLLAVPEGGRAEVRFRAGFAEAWEGLPPDLRQAVMLLAGRYFERRFDEAAEAAAPSAVLTLIERWRTIRTFGGGS